MPPIDRDDALASGTSRRQLLRSGATLAAAASQVVAGCNWLARGAAASEISPTGSPGATPIRHSTTYLAKHMLGAQRNGLNHVSMNLGAFNRAMGPIRGTDY